MAKSNFPVMKSGGGMLWKVVGLLLGLAVIVLVVKHPADSARWVSGLFGGGVDVVDGVATFLSNLFG
ncbi:hypothetical protein ACIA5G_09320 [Amycolatopsis sp. NPDC051758]|uniref:hypothetical protein n=1 Tax=Amycolatopsis sp. NPDC051758 TaxID=3363935 RepID=UPI00379C89FA